MLLPYIPNGSQGINDTTWEKGYHIWTTQLIKVLSLDDTAFLQKVERDQELASWIQSLLQTQLDLGNTETGLLRLVYLIYVRLGTVLELSSSSTSSPLISITSLDTFSLVFARANPTTTQTLFAQLFANQKGLRDQYETSIYLLVDTLNTIGSYIATMTSQQETKWEQSFLERILVVTRLLEAKILCLNSKHLSSQLQPALMSSYEQLLDGFTTTTMTKDNKDLENKEDSTAHVDYWIYLVKQSLVNIFNTMVEINYLTPLEALGQSESCDDDNKESLVAALSDQILQWVEQSHGLETIKTAFVDAPLIMDWQVEWQVAKRLDQINQDLFRGENEQLSFLTLVMDTQIQELASNPPQSWSNRIKRQQKKQQQQQMDQSMSSTSTTVTTMETNDDYTNYIKRTSLISQVRDIFSDLGEGFIETCLIANDDDAEMVIMQLLENNLPSSVSSLDRTMERAAFIPSATTEVIINSIPRTSILDSRKNIFDKDEFDVFSGGIVEKSKVYVGKKNDGTADSLLENKKHTEDEKVKMLRRIYDMYEDEIDDSYDSVNEVTGPVDLAAVDEGGEAALDVVRAKKQQTVDPGVLNESELVHVYVDHPEVFDRSSATRKSAQRDALRKRTNMTDEQLEGWAIMFNRNPRKQRILDKYMLFDGNQDQVDATVKASQQQKQKESPSRKPPPISESRQRAYKDKNKARFGNHNRKKNHDKKLAKLGGPTSAT
ncbi:uncharacterized protein BX664DRAFT_360997 [Halteromyces radiatus]|uniref:uncharacterized protein n=1 Tax=Halteromyces radiatus TaxID=101107 RepID=UPI00221FE78B|nr:uncharacterized protein BX664DRAFT_360997 [Halteromyces radiatus]KAI8082692.1 hypothetical protein BX664DRAFT_360997 [Halteromyces radiatus]